MSIKKVSSYRNQPQMDDINRLTAAVNELIESGGQGDKGDKGDNGDNGWTPVLSLVEREDDLVIQIADLVGGTGNPPNFYIGRYVGATGLVTDILDAVNVRGMKGLKGEAGEDGDNGVGIPLGGLTGHVLAKASDDSYDTHWVEASAGGASSLLDLTDTPNDYGNNGQVLGIQSDWQGIPTVEWINVASGGVDSFFDLTETPNDYGSNGQVLTTVLDWMGIPTLEWTTPDSGGGDIAFTDLTDTPSSLGSVGQVPVVFFDANINDLALRFEDLPEGGGGGGGSGYGEWIRFTDSPIVSPDVTTRSEWNWYREEDGYCVYHFGFEMRMTVSGNGQIRLVPPMPTFTGDNIRRQYEFQYTLTLRQGNNHWTPYTHECALEPYTNHFMLRNATGGIISVGEDWVRCRGTLRYKLPE